MLKEKLSEETILQNKLLQELASLLFVYRKKNKITLKQLSSQTDNNIGFLNDLEQGKHNTQITNYLKIAKFLKIPASELEGLISKYFRGSI